MNYETMVAKLVNGNLSEVAGELRSMRPVDAALAGMKLAMMLTESGDLSTRDLFYKHLYFSAIS